MTGQPKRTPPMKWLRLYHEARTDAKLESLPDDEFRVWFRLLCFAGAQPERGVIANVSPRLLAVEVAHGDVALLQRTLISLAELRIIETSDDAHVFIHWDKRQFESDNVTKRVLKHRGQLDEQNETFLKRFSNGHVTLPDAEEDAETEAKRENLADVADEITPRARARAATNSNPSGTPRTVVDLCEQIAQRTHLSRRVEVMDQLSAVIESHVARGLSLGDIWRDVLNLIDPSREKHVKRPTISQISNWLAHTHPANDLTSTRASPMRNGHRPVTAATASRPILTADDVYPD